MRKAKFYRVEGDTITCASVSLGEVSLDQAERVLASLRFFRKDRLPPEVRRKLPAGGVKSSVTFRKTRVQLKKDPKGYTHEFDAQPKLEQLPPAGEFAPGI